MIFEFYVDHFLNEMLESSQKLVAEDEREFEQEIAFLKQAQTELSTIGNMIHNIYSKNVMT